MIILIDVKNDFDLKAKKYIEDIVGFNKNVFEINSIFQIQQMINRYGIEKVKIFYSKNLDKNIYNEYKYIVYKIKTLKDIDDVLLCHDPLPNDVPKIKDLITFEINKKLNLNDICNLLIQSKINIDEKKWNLIKKLIKDISMKENSNVIKLIGYGRFSLVFRIKSKILKIGYPRFKFNVPYSGELIMPFYRKEIDNLYLEIQERIDSRWYLKYSREQALEEVYVIFKKLRENNIYWFDPKPENIGVLLKKNIESNYINHEKGIDNIDIKDIKSKGDKVITDIDLLYSKDELYIIEEIIKKEPYIINSKPMQMFIKLEKRYEIEKGEA